MTRITLAKEVALHLESYALYCKENGADDVTLQLLRDLDRHVVEKVERLQKEYARVLKRNYACRRCGEFCKGKCDDPADPTDAH